MINNNYFEIINAKLNFVLKHFRVLRLLIIIIYLFFLAALVIDVFTAISYVPDIREVKVRFLPITAKTDIIGSIERYFLDRENSLNINLQKKLSNNPFAPRATVIEDAIPIDNPVNISVDNLEPSPSINVIN